MNYLFANVLIVCLYIVGILKSTKLILERSEGYKYIQQENSFKLINPKWLQNKNYKGDQLNLRYRKHTTYVSVEKYDF